MPAVQDILSTINQFAQARLPLVTSWRAAGCAQQTDPLLGPEQPDPPESAYAHAGVEPLLDEVLCDPVVQLIMQADRVRPADLQDLLDSAPPSLVAPTVTQ